MDEQFNDAQLTDGETDLPASSEGDHIRNKANTITTFNQMLEAVAETFDLHGVIGDDDGGEEIPEPDPPADETRSKKK